MGFGIVEGFWRIITGTVIWTADVDLMDGPKISFRLKRKDGVSYVVMALRNFGAYYYAMDRHDLHALEGALCATILDTSRLQALAREKQIELMRLGVLDRILRSIIIAPLWKEDIFVGGGKISFRIRKEVDKHAEVLIGSGEESYRFSMNYSELEALEDALRATKAELEESRDTDLPTTAA